MIGIIGAMEEEVAELKKDMQIDETIEQAGMVFCKGSLGGKDVVIVDFSYSKADMQRLLSFANSVLVLDHHVSAERELEGFEAPNFKFVYNVNKSGAGLTWDYFYPSSQQPMVVQYIQDGDLWTDKYTGTPYLGTFLESSNFTVPEFVEFIQRVINEEIEQPKPSYDSLNVAIGDGLEIGRAHV